MDLQYFRLAELTRYPASISQFQFLQLIKIVGLNYKQKPMSQFYNRYKNLFLSQGRPYEIKSQPYINNQSFIKPSNNQFRHRQNAQLINRFQNKLRGDNRFESEILPALNHLNKQKKEKIGVPTEPNIPIYYTPENSNKYKNLELRPSTKENSKSMSQNFRMQFSKLDRKETSGKNLNERTNPQQLGLQDSLNQQVINKSKVEGIKVKTEGSIIDYPRGSYGYPQTYQGLVFSQYEKQNQFQLINNRINDLRKIQKYYPRGNLNSYRQALIRRKQCKEKLVDRRTQLKKIFSQQMKQYLKKAPII